MNALTTYTTSLGRLYQILNISNDFKLGPVSVTRLEEYGTDPCYFDRSESFDAHIIFPAEPDSNGGIFTITPQVGIRFIPDTLYKKSPYANLVFGLCQDGVNIPDTEILDRVIFNGMLYTDKILMQDYEFIWTTEGFSIKTKQQILYISFISLGSDNGIKITDQNKKFPYSVNYEEDDEVTYHFYLDYSAFGINPMKEKLEGLIYIIRAIKKSMI